MLSDTGPFGAPLFAKLVPFAVHIAANIYAERRDRLVNNAIIDELEAMTAKLHEYAPHNRIVVVQRQAETFLVGSLLQSLNLPGSLQALEKPLGLPPGIAAHSEEVRQQGGMDKLLASIQDIQKLRANDVALFDETKELLRTEAADDEKSRAKHGTDRWQRESSPVAAAKLLARVAEYEGILQSADNSDKHVRARLAEHEPIIRLLDGPIHDLEEFVPNSSRTKLTAKVDREVGRLRQFINEASRLESRRRRKVESLRQKAKADDISRFFFFFFPSLTRLI